MRKSPLKKIDYSSSYFIKENFPKGLKRILKKRDMGYHNNGGNQVFRSEKVQVTIFEASFLDRIVSFCTGNSGSEVMVVADAHDSALFYENIISDFLDSKGAKYKFSKFD